MLEKPIRIGSLELRNRLVMPPMATERSAGGEVTEALVNYYDEMSAGGWLGLIVQEHAFITMQGKASPNQISFAEDECIPGLKRVTDVIHKNGVPVIAQLNHAGNAARKEVTGMEAVSASSTLNPRKMSEENRVLPREMTQADIDRVIGCFADAAERAQKAGYDGIEIHSAHGYLLNQFYSPLTNRRTDAYTGASIEGRTRFHVQVAEAIRARTGKDFLIALRLGAADYMEGGSDVSEVPEAAERFAEAGVDLLSISGGMCGFSRPDHSEPGWFAELSEAARTVPGLPVLLTGGICEKADAERLLREEKADLIGVGRAFLADHRLPEKWMR
jgi:2,4-dienoyl-CoA reductase-like NADH-dependent reductase (Old Yellow Enzyme family)